MPEIGDPGFLVLSDIDVIALLFLSVITFYQQSGFASLEAGSVRAKNVKNILLKTLLDKLICGIVFYLVGFAFSYGADIHGFIGSSYFALQGADRAVNTLFFLSYVFLITSTTIVSGCLAERAQFAAYLAYTPVMAGVVYPLVSHWMGNGWLAKMSECRFLDFAGGATVHLIGGIGGLVATWVIGPRRSRFENGQVKPMPGHNVTSVAKGTLQLWFGWYAFNAAPSFLRGDDRAGTAARVFANTTVSACFAGFTSFVLSALMHMYGKKNAAVYDLRVVCDGIMSGIVGITSIAPFIDHWGAAIIGICAAVVCVLWTHMLLQLEIDDPLNSTAVHGGAALVGILGVGFLAQPEYIRRYRPGQPRLCGGIFYESHRLGAIQLGMQVLGAVVMGVFSGLCSFATFGTLKYFGHLRIQQNEEVAGIDAFDHGGNAYPEFQNVRIPEYNYHPPLHASDTDIESNVPVAHSTSTSHVSSAPGTASASELQLVQREYLENGRL